MVGYYWRGLCVNVEAQALFGIEEDAGRRLAAKKLGEIVLYLKLDENNYPLDFPNVTSKEPILHIHTAPDTKVKELKPESTTSMTAPPVHHQENVYMTIRCLPHWEAFLGAACSRWGGEREQ